MALMNLTISYSAAWQGIAAEAWGYPRTMLVDVVFGMICIAAIPFMARKAGEAFADDAAPVRARGVAAVLGLMCLAWLPYGIWHEAFGAAQPIAGTVFTLVFIASALFLLAGRAVLGDAAQGLTRIGAWLAPLLFAMYARYFIDGIAGWFSFLMPAERFGSSVEIVMYGIALASGVVLLLLARRPWRELRPQPAGAPAS
jgi:MFS transporter, PAT family, beta-lactamase induction signal transducer AmpG